jgi:hypothetical protein
LGLADCVGVGVEQPALADWTTICLLVLQNTPNSNKVRELHHQLQLQLTDVQQKAVNKGHQQCCCMQATKKTK